MYTKYDAEEEREGGEVEENFHKGLYLNGAALGTGGVGLFGSMEGGWGEE